MSEWDEFNNWLNTGINRGWCSQSVCETHDGLPWTEEEASEWQDGNDFCVPAVRLWGMERIS
jgi:hypothetical protein